MYRNFQLTKTHYEEGRDQVLKWGHEKSQGFTPKLKKKFEAQFPAGPEQYEVSEKGNFVNTTKMSVAKLIHVQAPGLLAVTAGSMLDNTTFSTCFKEVVELAEAKWHESKATGTSRGTDAHEPEEDSLNNNDVEGTYKIQEYVATVVDNNSRDSWCTGICTFTCRDQPTAYMSVCSCGAPITLGYPCGHLRAHARKLGMDVHEIADHRLLASTLKHAYKEAGAFGDVRVF